MIEVVTGVLKRKRKESAIKFELFTASSHENVIQDLEGHTKITVMDDEETTLKCLKTNPTKPPKTRVRCSLPGEEFAARSSIRHGRNGKKLYPNRW
jgi:hypothetical protein